MRQSMVVQKHARRGVMLTREKSLHSFFSISVQFIINSVDTSVQRLSFIGIAQHRCHFINFFCQLGFPLLFVSNSLMFFARNSFDCIHFSSFSLLPLYEHWAWMLAIPYMQNRRSYFLFFIMCSKFIEIWFDFSFSFAAFIHFRFEFSICRTPVDRRRKRRKLRKVRRTCKGDDFWGNCFVENRSYWKWEKIGGKLKLKAHKRTAILDQRWEWWQIIPTYDKYNNNNSDTQSIEMIGELLRGRKTEFVSQLKWKNPFFGEKYSLKRETLGQLENHASNVTAFLVIGRS